MYYGYIDPPSNAEVRYVWESPKKLTVVLIYCSAANSLEFEEKNGTTKLTYEDFMQGVGSHESDD